MQAAPALCRLHSQVQTARAGARLGSWPGPAHPVLHALQPHALPAHARRAATGRALATPRCGSHGTAFSAQTTRAAPACPPQRIPNGAKAYSDETDIMACCHGDYSVWARVKVRCARRVRHASASHRQLARSESHFARFVSASCIVRYTCSLSCVKTAHLLACARSDQFIAAIRDQSKLTEHTKLRTCCCRQASFAAPMSAASCPPPTSRHQSTTMLTLCPYDRAECRGKLMAVSFAPEAGTTVVLGFRSMPFWQDLPVQEGAVDAARARENLGGLSVVTGVDRGTGRAFDRTLLDFNTLYGTWPNALPTSEYVRSCLLRLL